MYGLVKCSLILCAAVAATGFVLGDNDVIFHLYTRANPEVSQPLAPTLNAIVTSFFSTNRPTYFTIHSSGESVASQLNAFAVPAILSNMDANVIAVDWSPGSPMYTIGLSNTPKAGEQVAQFLDLLTQTVGYTGRITLVGLGLGAHIAGIAARKGAVTVPHIIALEPSLHGWTHNPDILSSNAATLVEVLHTTAGIKGYDKPLGHLDFYPNGGRMQPGCLMDADCSYNYSYIFFAESITAEVNNGNNFVGTSCESYDEALQLQCDGEHDTIFGGTSDKTGASGVYSFITNTSPPFARG